MEKTIRLKRELAYTGMILKIYRDTVVANRSRKSMTISIMTALPLFFR